MSRQVAKMVLHVLRELRPRSLPSCREIGNLLPNNRRQRRTCHALCHILYPVSAAQTSIFRMDSNSTSYIPSCIKTRSLFVNCRRVNSAYIRQSGPASGPDSHSNPQKALSGGIPGAVLEPLGRSWSHFVGIYRQKLTKSSKHDF